MTMPIPSALGLVCGNYFDHEHANNHDHGLDNYFDHDQANNYNLSSESLLFTYPPDSMSSFSHSASIHHKHTNILFPTTHIFRQLIAGANKYLNWI